MAVVVCAPDLDGGEGRKAAKEGEASGALASFYVHPATLLRQLHNVLRRRYPCCVFKKHIVHTIAHRNEAVEGDQSDVKGCG